MAEYCLVFADVGTTLRNDNMGERADPGMKIVLADGSEDNWSVDERGEPPGDLPFGPALPSTGRLMPYKLLGGDYERGRALGRAPAQVFWILKVARMPCLGAEVLQQGQRPDSGGRATPVLVSSHCQGALRTRCRSKSRASGD